MSLRLDRAVREARDHLGTREAQGIDWSAIDRGVFGRIEEARRSELSGLSSGRARTLTALVLTAAAAAAFVTASLSGRKEPPPFDAVRLAATGAGGATTAGGNDAFVNGNRAPAGVSLQVGDLIEARGGIMTVDRPGKLSLVVERGSRATVTHLGSALVLALEEGAIEAQVVPVPGGEPFAVDVGPSRVAVHGTHFRVAHRGDQVVVDLSEGVVIVGETPRVGSELGVVITAPAHVEFEPSNAARTLEVKHEPSAVRATSAVLRATEPRSAASAAALPASPPRPERGESHASMSAVTPRADAGVTLAPPRPDKMASSADPNAASVLANAVRTCMAEMPRAENVTIVVSTTLQVDLFDDGTVRSARFEPPVATDVNTCAAASIYKSRFTSTGHVAIPIDFAN